MKNKLHVIKPIELFQRIGIDIVGLLPITEKGNTVRPPYNHPLYNNTSL